MKKSLRYAFCIVFILFLSAWSTLAQNWYPIYLSQPYRNFFDVSFRSNITITGIRTLDGWIVGEGGVILRSKDNNGESWYEYPSPTNKNLYSISMLGSQYGCAVGESGTILWIRDTNWELQPSITINNLYSVSISPTSIPTVINGWAVGSNGLILRWNDTNRIWVAQNSGVTADLYGVFCLGDREGWAVGSNSTILYTNNNGVSWTKIEVEELKSIPNITLRSVYFHNNNNGWIVGDGGVVLYWNNGKFTLQKVNTSSRLNDVDFVDSTRGWIAGDSDTVISTTNAGTSWQTHFTNNNLGNIYGIDFANRENGIVVGENGLIMRYFSTTPPTELKLISPFGDVTNQKVTFVWTTNKPNLEHTIYLDDDIDPFNDQISAYLAPVGSTSYTIDLQPGVYYWGIRVADGAISEVLRFRLWQNTTITLKSPSGFIADDAPTFEWDCNNKDLATLTYTIFIDKDDYPYDVTGIPVGSALNYKFTRLAEGNYSWGIRSSDGSMALPPMKFTVDISPPTGSVVINNGEGFTNSPIANLRLTATDVSGVSQMQFSSNGVIWSNPEPFTNTKSWDLSLYGGNDQDGLKTVYVKYKDNLGHWMVAPAKAETILDRVPPTGTISINDGAEATGPSGVKLTLRATDDNSGMGKGKMLLSNDGVTWSPELPYETIRNWSFSVYGGNLDEGIKTVYVKYADAAGNWMDTPVSDNIRLDKTGPTGTIVINDGAEFTNSLLVDLTLFASDVSGVAYMQFTNGGNNWSPQEPYNTKRAGWDMSKFGGSTNQGQKAVYARFIDTVGNISAQSTSDSIFYKFQITGKIQISSPRIQDKVKNGDLISVIGNVEPELIETKFEVMDENEQPLNIDLAKVSYDVKTGDISGSFNAETLTSKSIKLILKVKDKPGNEAEFASNMLIVDNDPPRNIDMSINQGDITNSALIDLTISAADALEMYLAGDVKDQNKWIPYATSMKINLTDGDGNKNVRIKFRDDMENESGEIRSSIILDTTPPIGSLLINDGDDLSKSFIASLKLSASDTYGIVAYQLSNDGTKWTDEYPWTSAPNEPIKINEWDLQLEVYGGNSAEGLKTVYVRYKDKVGNWSESFTDDVQVIISGPSISVELIKDRQEALEPVIITVIIKSASAPVIEAYLYYGIKGSYQYKQTSLIKLPGAGDYYRGEIPGADVTLAGIDYYITASDGIWTATRPDRNPAINPYSFTVIDSTPPAIEHEPLGKLSVKTSPVITAKVTDKLGVKSVRLFYRSDVSPGGSKSFTRVDMTAGANSNEFSVTIAALDSLGVIEYYIEALDNLDNSRKVPIRGADQPYIIYFTDTQSPVIVHTKIPNDQEAGKPVVIGATITDNMAVALAILRYKTPVKNEFIESRMSNVGNYYSGEIPGSEVMPGVIEYWIIASDGSPDSEDAKASYVFTVVDTTPPIIEILSAPTQVLVNANISIEARVTDNVKVDLVRLYYKDVESAALFTGVDMRGVGNRYTASIPAQKRAGQARFYIYARDSQGISATEPLVQPENNPRIITVSDTSKPTIEHSPSVEIREAGNEVVISAVIKDDVRIADASLHYRLSGQTAFKSIVMKETEKPSVYAGIIPGDSVLPPRVEYYIRALDDSANMTTHPDTRPNDLPHSFSVVDNIPPIIDYDPSKLKEVLVTDPIFVNVKVTDLAGVKEVTVYYRLENEVNYKSLIARYTGNDIYSTNIPQPMEEISILYYIQAEDNSGNKATSPKDDPAGKPYSIFVDDPFPPLPPTRLTAASAPGGKIILTWELSLSPDTYKYNIYTDSGSGVIDYSKAYASVDMKTKSWESPSLGEGVYRFVVRAEDKSGNEEKNTIYVSAIADSVKPEKVTNLEAISRPGGRIELRWTPSLSKDAFIYNIYWDNAQLNIDYTKQLARVNDPISSWTSEPLRDGVIYRFIVRCQDQAGNEEENIAHVSARADATPPQNVTGLFSPTHKVNLWSNQPEVTVSWTPAGDTGTGLAGYSILWDSNPNSLPNAILDIHSLSSIQYTVSGVQYFHIRPVDNAGNWSNTAAHYGPFMIDTQTPQPPTGLSATPQAGGRVKLEWRASSSDDVIIYNIYWDNGLGGGIDYSKAIAQTSLTIWTSSQLEDGRTYQFSVRAEDRANNEEKNTQRVSSIADGKPPTISHIPIMGMLEDDIESVSINATVIDSSGLDSVKLYYRKHGESSYKNVNIKAVGNAYTGEIPASTFTSAGVDYYIAAVDKAGNIAEYPVTTIEVSATLRIPISSSRGNEILIGDNLFIKFPMGSISEDGVLTVSIPSIIPEPQAGLKRHILTREIKLDVKLVRAIDVKLTYKDNKVIGEDEERLALYLWGGNRWNFLKRVEPANNQANLSTMELGIFSIIGDYESPIIEDLRPIGYAEPKAQITARVMDNGSGVDLTSIIVQLNNQNLAVPITALKDEILSLDLPANLDIGQYSLIITVSDRSGNQQTAKSTFFVENLLSLKDVYCYPNPFHPARGVNFAYTLTESANSVTIRIFSLDGKLVKKLEGKTSVGVNMVSWDCQDEAGELILNRVYMCHIEAEGSKDTVRSTIKIMAWE